MDAQLCHHAAVTLLPSLTRFICPLGLGLALLLGSGEAAAYQCEYAGPYVSASYPLVGSVQIPSDGRFPFSVTAAGFSLEDALTQIDLSVSLGGEPVEGEFVYETLSEDAGLGSYLVFFVPAALLDPSQIYDLQINVHNSEPEAAQYHDRIWDYEIAISADLAAPPQPPTFSQIQLIEGAIGVDGLCCTVPDLCTDGTYEACATSLIRHVPWLIAGMEGDPLSYGVLEMIAEGGASSSDQAPMASWNSYVFEGTTYDGKVHGHKYEAMQDEYCMIGRLTSMMTGEVAESMHCVEHGDLPDSWDEPVEPNLDNEECLDEPYDPETGEPPVPGGTTGAEGGAGLDDAGSCGCTQTKDSRGGAGGLAAALLGLWGFARRRRSQRASA